MGNVQWCAGRTTDDGTGLTERQAAERKSLRLGLGPNINPKAAGTGGGEHEGTEDPPLSSIRSRQIPS